MAFILHVAIKINTKTLSTQISKNKCKNTNLFETNLELKRKNIIENIINTLGNIFKS